MRSAFGGFFAFGDGSSSMRPVARATQCRVTGQSRHDGLRGVQIESAEEDRKAAEQDALGPGEQGMRPVHRSAQCLLAAHRDSGTAGQQSEAVMQAVDDLGQRQRADPRGGKLDRQWHAVEPPADLDHGRAVVVGDGEARSGQAGAFGEQLDGFIGHGVPLALGSNVVGG